MIESREKFNNNMMNLLGLDLTNLHSHALQKLSSFLAIINVNSTKLLKLDSSTKLLKHV